MGSGTPGAFPFTLNELAALARLVEALDLIQAGGTLYVLAPVDSDALAVLGTDIEDLEPDTDEDADPEEDSDPAEDANDDEPGYREIGFGSPI